MSFRVLEASDPGWNDVLSKVPHDVYHLPGYARLTEVQEGLTVQLAVAEAGKHVVALPFMLRPLPTDARFGDGHDITTPYGYPGPVCSSSDPDVQRALVSELLSGLTETGAVSAFVRCHPLVGVGTDALAPFGEVVVHGDQVVIDLKEVGSEALASFRAGHRRDIRILRDQGFALRADDKLDISAFPSLYRKNMERLEADRYYWFGDDYFTALWETLGENAHLVVVTSPEDTAAACALFFVTGEIAQYHLSATDARYLRLAPSKLSILGMADLCRSLGVRYLNLGGGVGGQADALFAFKAGFSRMRVPFATARFVLDEERYAYLSSPVDAPEGFFPSYRAPR